VCGVVGVVESAFGEAFDEGGLTSFERGGGSTARAGFLAFVAAAAGFSFG